MDSFLQAVLIQMSLYVGLAVFVIVALNWGTNGFILKWFSVKSSRGVKTLLKVRTLANDYFTTGILKDGFMEFKGRNGKKRIAMGNQHSSAFYQAAGVRCLDVDDEKNGFVMHDWSKVSGFDAEKFEDLITRALMKPSLLDKNTQIILIILIVGFILLGFGLYMVYGKFDVVLEAVSQLRNISQPVAQAVITGGGEVV